MRAEGPKEHPTAVLCVQLSANSKYYALADITSLRFDVCAFAHTYVYMLRALRVPRRSRVNSTAIAMSSHPVVHHIYHGASSRRCNCAKASLYKKMTPQLLNVKLAGSPKRKAYSYIDKESELKKTYALASSASTTCIVRTYNASFRVEYKTAD